MTGKDLTNPTGATPASINREAIQKQNRELARDLWQGKLSRNEQQAMNNLALTYGLDPLQKQLLCLGGNFYVTVGGLKVLAARDENPPDSIQLVPANMEERTLAGITANDPTKPNFTHFWKATLYKKGKDIPYVEYGEATAEDVGIRGKNGGRAAEKDIRAIARTRATGRVLRNAYSVGLPMAEDAPVDITAIEAEIVEMTPAPTTPKPKAKANTPAPEQGPDVVMITGPQIGKIHVLKEKAIDNGLISEDDYYNALKDIGVEHSNELTKAQASALIDRLDKLITANEPPEEEASEDGTLKL